jgi:hypothetical protein
MNLNVNLKKGHAASLEVCCVLMLVSLLVACFSSSSADNNNVGIVKGASCNIVSSPAFSINFSGQSEAFKSENLNHFQSKNSTISIRNCNKSLLALLAFQSEGFDTSNSDNFSLGIADNAFQNLKYQLIHIANVVLVSRKAFQYIPVFNYSAQEKYQA